MPRLINPDLDRWLRTRRGGFFIILFTLFLILGTAVTAVALIYGGTSGSGRLAVAGEFASGVAAFFGLAGVSAALIANYVVQNPETHDAERAWTTKIRLQEAMVIYLESTRHAAQNWRREHPDDPSFSEVGLDPVYRHSLEQLADAICSARQSGLIRVLSLLSRQQGKLFDLGLELWVVECHVRNDLALSNPGIGMAPSCSIPDSIEALRHISYDDMAGMWDKPWPASDRALEVARMLCPDATDAVPPTASR